MSGNWQESSERTITLPDDEPEIFALYVHWLYYGTLHVSGDVDRGGHPDVNHHREYFNLVKAYILGDKLLDSKFHDAAIDAMVKSALTTKNGTLYFPSIDIVEYAYNHSNETARIRELLVDMYVRHAKSKWLYVGAETGRNPHAFLNGLAAKLLDRPDVLSLKLEASKYHIHVSDDGTANLKKGNSRISDVHTASTK